MAWGESDVDARDCMLSQALTQDAVYEDPMGRSDGIDALSDTIGNTLASLPDANIELVGDPDARESEARFAWSFRDAETELIPGEDFVEFAQDGRLERITGFFGPIATDPPDGAIADLLEAWNSDDAEERQTLLESALAEDARFTDGSADAVGPDDIGAALSGELTVESVNKYGDPLRLRAVGDLDGETFVAYARLDDAGRIERIALFSGEL